MINSMDSLLINNINNFDETANAEMVRMIATVETALSSLKQVRESSNQCDQFLSDLKIKLINEKKEKSIYIPLFLLSCFSAGLYFGFKKII